MRVIETQQITPIVKELAIEACCNLNGDLIDALKKAFSDEESPMGKEIISTLLENAEYARKEQVPCCQDTGVAVVYMEIGQEVCWKGQPLLDVVNEGVRQGYREGYLRKSVAKDPIIRENSNDNTPAILHTEIVPGNKVKITILPKGFGSENMNRLTMLKPADGVEGIKNFVIETVKLAGGKSCPPLIVGVGIGGTTDKAAQMAKKAVLHPIGERNKEGHIAELENELLSKINNLGIGPLGLGGRVTALDVHIETYATHIAGLPVAVNLQCHANRHATAVL